MADVVFVAITLGFFALCALYVTWCDHIIGPDPDPAAEPAGGVPERDATPRDEDLR